MTSNPRNRKKVVTKNSKFKSKNGKIEKKKECVVNLKVMKNAGLIKEIMVESKQRIKPVGSKVKTNDGPKVIAKKMDDLKAKGRAARALKREEKEREKAQVEDRENRAEKRALRIAREWEAKREKERQLLKKREASLVERAKILSLEETKENKTPKTSKTKTPSTKTPITKTPTIQIQKPSPKAKEPSPKSKEPSSEAKDKNETSKSEKELRMEAREKARAEEEAKKAEEYWPEWDEMKKTKKKRKKTADRLVFKQSDYNMTDSDESSDEDEDSRYASNSDRTSEPSTEVAKPAPQSDKPTKHIPFWAQGDALEKALEKQSEQSAYDLDSLFSQVEMPDIKLMFPKIKKKFVRRTSSAIWLAPPPASFMLAPPPASFRVAA